MVALLLVTTTASVAAVGAVFLWPPPSPKPAPELRVILPKPLASIGEGEVVSFPAPAGAAFLIADGEGNNRPGSRSDTALMARSKGVLRLFAAASPHLGCTVTYQGDGSIADPCGGARWNLDGSPADQGPVFGRLATIKWRQTGPAEIAIAAASSR